MYSGELYTTSILLVTLKLHCQLPTFSSDLLFRTFLTFFFVSQRNTPSVQSQELILQPTRHYKV